MTTITHDPLPALVPLYALSRLYGRGVDLLQGIYHHARAQAVTLGHEVYQQVRLAENNADALITVYRVAAPGTRINEGDTVTLSQTAANATTGTHGITGHVVTSHRIRADELWTDGASPATFTYSPTPRD